jgi:hypothetical protein
MALFLLGSVACGLSRSMEQLVLFRVVQGLGVGAIAPTGTTIAADLYTLEERAKIQGVFTASWGAANVAGPPLGGFLVTHWSWRWVFLASVPFVVIAVALLLLAYNDPPRRKAEHPLDFAGAGLAAIAIAALLLAADRHLEAGLVLWLGLAGLAVAALVAFVRRERRIADPIVPRTVVADRFVRGGVIGSLFVGAIIYAPMAYVPLWIARATGGDALAAGRALVPMLVGWSIGSTLGVRVLVKRGVRHVATGGLAIAAGAATLLALVVGGALPSSLAPVAIGVLGLGLGPAANAFLLGSQMRVGWKERGVVTSSVHAARSLGGSLAIAILAATGDADASARRFVVFAALVWAGLAIARRVVPPESGAAGIAKSLEPQRSRAA